MEEILKHNTNEKASISDTSSGTSTQKKGKDIDKIRRLVKESEDETRRLMLEAEKLLQSIFAASKKQRNINKTIKGGLPVLENILESMADNHYSGLFTRCRLAERSVQKQHASANSVRENHESRKRAAASPPVPPAEKETKKGGRSVLE